MNRRLSRIHQGLASIALAPGGVPEPLSLGLFGIGLVGLAAARRKR